MATGPTLILVLILAMYTIGPISVNSRRKRRDEARFHGPLAITMVVALNIAAFVALAVALAFPTGWGIAMSALSLVASWISLLVMLSRGVRRVAAVPADGPDPDFQYSPGHDYGSAPHAPQQAGYGAPPPEPQPGQWPAPHAPQPGQWPAPHAPQPDIGAPVYIQRSRPPRPAASWLEITTQIAGILSLVVSVIALLKS